MRGVGCHLKQPDIINHDRIGAQDPGDYPADGVGGAVRAYQSAEVLEPEPGDPHPRLDDGTALLTWPEFSDANVAFSEKYRNQTISFDAQVSGIACGSAARWVNVLVLAGEVGSNKGPNFQITGDPTVVNSLIPANIAVGQNIRPTAQVGKFNDAQGLLLLDVVSIEPR